MKQGDISALIVQNPFKMGYDGVDALVKIIREGAKPKGGDTGATVVTKENLESKEVQAVLNPTCDNPLSVK